MNKSKYILLIILVVASTIDLLIPTLLGFKYPNYSHLNDTISTLGTPKSPVNFLARLNLIVVGVLFIIFAYGQKKIFTDINWSINLYSIGIIVFGLGCILSGIFPEDIKDLNEETISGKLHGISSGIGFMLLILCPLWAIFMKNSSINITINIVLFVLSTSTFIIFLLSENIETGILKFTGLYQRLNLIFIYSCIIINYLCILNKSQIE